MRNRHELHVNKLEEYTVFCVERGWKLDKPVGDWEVLRMRHPDVRMPLLVHKRLTTGNNTPLVHYTTNGESTRMLKQFLARRTDDKRTKTSISSSCP